MQTIQFKPKQMIDSKFLTNTTHTFTYTQTQNNNQSVSDVPVEQHFEEPSDCGTTITINRTRRRYQPETQLSYETQQKEALSNNYNRQLHKNTSNIHNRHEWVSMQYKLTIMQQVPNVTNNIVSFKQTSVIREIELYKH